MRVLLTIDALEASAGGTTEAVLQLAGALAERGADVHVAARSTQRDGGPAARPAIVRIPDDRRSWADAVASLSPDVIHDHGLWLPSNWRVAAAARHGRRPRLVSTHGMLARWARRHHGARKLVAWSLYQKRLLQTAAAVHATSPAEAVDIADAGITVPIAVIPHGVAIPDVSRVPNDKSVRRAVFLGRFHPVKNLPVLIEAWAKVRPPGWELVLAGPDERRLRAGLEAQCVAAGIRESVRFEGLLSREAKQELLATSSLLVLPSLTENFGVSVAEGLAAGLPAIVSTRAPWGVLDAAGAGWSVEPDATALAGAIRAATTRTAEELAAMGARGRDLVSRRYSWSAVADRMMALYERAATTFVS